MSPGVPRYEDLIGLWQDGGRRLTQLEGRERTSAERIADAVEAELAHRLGGTFTVQELAELYIEQGTDWCFDIAVRVAPTTPEAWDLTIVAGTAFARYARSAVDYSTGRRLIEGGNAEI